VSGSKLAGRLEHGLGLADVVITPGLAMLLPDAIVVGLLVTAPGLRHAISLGPPPVSVRLHLEILLVCWALFYLDHRSGNRRFPGTRIILTTGVVVHNASDHGVDVLITVQVMLEGLLWATAMLECLSSKLEPVLKMIMIITPPMITMIIFP
jgi:hypothetical protein